MSENAVPFLDLAKLQDARLADRRMDAARLLISPRPRRSSSAPIYLAHPGSTNNTPAVPKRKRPGVASTPSRTTRRGHANPKPRKAHRKRTDSSQQDSPTRPAFPPPLSRPPPPQRDAPARPVRAAPRRLTPPREVVLQTPTAQSKPRRRPSVSASVSQSAAHARPSLCTPARLSASSSTASRRSHLPSISPPHDAPSPSDDPLLLVASSSPIKRHHARNAASPSSDYAPFDWTAHAAPPQDGSTDSMDVEPDAEVEAYDGPLPAVLSAWDAPAGAWDSDDDEEGELPSVPTATASAPPWPFLHLPLALPHDAAPRRTH
ncbi:hypothetical protein B0H10DRAFT_2236069 [Mycena sp. CBHHK59/15]|nr:hypothetical protein B0H10DRAFT_2236069 [Mycena sp. CBHHK59/15]